MVSASKLTTSIVTILGLITLSAFLTKDEPSWVISVGVITAVILGFTILNLAGKFIDWYNDYNDNQNYPKGN